jgi:hypothetical protein
VATSQTVNMQTIPINNKFVSLHNIQQCIESFEKIKSSRNSKKRLVITAKEHLEGIDPILISYFILFKKQVPDLQVTIELPYNPLPDNPLETEIEPIQFQLMQFGTFAYLMTGAGVFQIVFGIGKKKRLVEFDLNKYPSFPERWFVFSASYFPILLISEDFDFFEFIFNKKLSELAENYNFDINKIPTEWSKSSEQVKRSYHSYLRKESIPNERLKALFNLALMAFVNSLDEAKIAHLFFKDNYKKSDFNHTNRIQAGNLQNKKAFKYFSAVEPVFEELKNSSLCHQFFFSTILATEMLSDKALGRDALTEASKTSFINKIRNLWGFTKDLVAGVKELAKNIREHSDPRLGVISVRLFEVKKWIQNKNFSENDNSIFSKYNDYILSRGYDGNSSVIDINILDIGKSGVIPTLIKDTKTLFSKISGRNNVIENLIREDIVNLKSKKIGFRNLLDTTAQQLNQQSKRSIAHFGLLTLSKLVEYNNGLVIASSQNDNSNNNREPICIPEFKQNYYHPIKIGTYYNIVLPINPNKSYVTHLPSKLDIPSETSAKDVKGIEELFNYETVNLSELRNNLHINPERKYLIQINFKGTHLNNREDEERFWDKILSALSSLKINAGIKYAFCFNLLNVVINESQLFRFLGKCELDFPSVPIIILNIENTCYQKLIKINGEFHVQNPNLAYWNENIATLIYSYQKILDARFNYSDVLWGKTKEEFVHLNRLVSFSSFNSTSILHPALIDKMISNAVESVNPKTDMFFLNTNNLLPFDLLLKGSENTTLFEENAIVFLSNELKP